MNLFCVLGITPIGIAFALIKKPQYKLAELFNFYRDMYWAWTYCIYIAFALIIWIQVEMIYLQSVHWSHTLYMLWAIIYPFCCIVAEGEKLLQKIVTISLPIYKVITSHLIVLPSRLF
ncbi:hypothetical protein CJD36_000860 [Flavipsychrobacter stenotrophus]|uniref:Uncharacterized protein n=1 Tax=Flavipsychrobacter stenotrophus TaxID=2077091 RepID=A0A2S7T0E6_9BACT|nr:hypothetical protein CJD36_000860 [Flavipsychrobacter stenotrophus]